MKLILSTPRLTLINCDEAILRKILEGDSALAAYLNITVTEKWNEFGTPSFQFSLDRLKEDATSVQWWTYLIILKTENLLVGDGGYKGPPDDHGVVEIGYEIGESFRKNGYAREATKALIDHAFSKPGVKGIRAHTLAEENASNKLLRREGFEFIEELDDPEDGKIWRWQLNR